MFLNVKQGFPILSIKKTLYPKTLYIPGVVYKFQSGLCSESYYGESIRHLDIRSRKHIGVSPLTRKKVKPSNNSAICDHLLHYNFLPTFGNFSILAHENKKYLLETKQSKPSLNGNINSASLYLFDKVSYQVLVYFTLVYLIYLAYFLLNIIIYCKKETTHQY